MDNLQEHRISYKAGITCSPSDFLCQNGELAECINLTTDHEELKTIVPPKLLFTVPGVTVKSVHKFNDQERFIGYETIDNEQLLCWGEIVDDSYTNHSYFETAPNQYFRYTEDTQLAIIGKMLIIANSSGTHYFLWTYASGNGTYKYMGTAFPRPEIEFRLDGRNEKEYIERQAVYDILYETGTNRDRYEIDDNKKESWNDAVIGLYERLRKKMWRDKKFHGSFCIRAALELSDGRYTHISNPIFMLNHFSEYGVASIGTSVHMVTMYMYGQRLRYKFLQDYSEWADIVKNVVLFVTKEANTVDLLSDATCYRGVYPEEGSYDNLPNDHVAYFLSGNKLYYDTHRLGDVNSAGESYRVLKSIPDSEIIDTIKEGVYYKLCEIGIKGTADWKDAGEHFDAHTIETLTTRPRLEEDDYYSLFPLKGSLLYAYNSRLNIANVSRGFFEGFDHFMPFDTEDYEHYWFYVKIKTDTGSYWVRHIKSTKEIQGIYFYYPDPRATHVTIYRWVHTALGETGDRLVPRCILDADLKEHPGLNGAYYFDTLLPVLGSLDGYEFPEVTVSSEGWVIADERSAEITELVTGSIANNKFEPMSNHIVQSEEDNPFVFKARGYNKVGTGRILAMSTTTMALSQDQFGKTDLIVFSESGIWGMQVDKTGLYESIHTITRDVLINPHNVIQTDGAVFFVTKKGLMVISENGVRCMSEQMNGKPFDYKNKLLISTQTEWDNTIPSAENNHTFHDYICSEKCVIAYDYIDSRMFIANSDYDYNYIMNIADGTISKAIAILGVTNVINNYPDYLLQSGNEIYSLYGKPRDEDYPDRLCAFLVTRPIKLSGPISKASVRELMNVGMWYEDIRLGPSVSVVKTEIFLSDDLLIWNKADSRFGAAAKYCRLVLYIKMLPTERLSGTIITTQERRTNNMR